MGTISVTLPSDGETADASDITSPINTIVNEINGNLDNANIDASAAISTSKLADDAGITAAKIAADAVTDAKLIYGKIRSRQGGSATNWGTSGTTTYDYSATDTFIQCGAITGNTDGAEKAVSFPTAFNQVPLVFVLSQTATSANVTDLAVNAVTTSGFNIRNVGANATTETIAWLAIGQ